MNLQRKRTFFSRIDGADANVSSVTSAPAKQISSENCGTNEINKDDCPPPTYKEALSIIAQNQRRNFSPIEPATTNSIVINIEEPTTIENVDDENT